MKHGYDVNPSSELKALGLTNMFGSTMTQSFLVMGAFGRSAVNESSGAKSQVSGIVGTLVVMALLLFVMPALFYLPKAVLAALIVMAVKKLINVGDFKRLWRVDKRDWLSMLAAFLATCFLGVLPGMITAMAFSLLLFIAFTTQPQVQELGRLSGTVIYREIGQMGVSRVPDVRIIRFVAPLFFANCTVLKDRLLLEIARRKQLPPRLQWRALVLDFQSIATIDSTSVQALEEVLAETRTQRLPLLIAGSNSYVEAFLTASGVVSHLGGRRFMHRRVHEAVRAVLLREVHPSDVPPPDARAPASTKHASGSGPGSGSGSGHTRSRSSHSRGAQSRSAAGAGSRTAIVVRQATVADAGARTDGAGAPSASGNGGIAGRFVKRLSLLVHDKSQAAPAIGAAVPEPASVPGYAPTAVAGYGPTASPMVMSPASGAVSVAVQVAPPNRSLPPPPPRATLAPAAAHPVVAAYNVAESGVALLMPMPAGMPPQAGGPSSAVVGARESADRVNGHAFGQPSAGAASAALVVAASFTPGVDDRQALALSASLMRAMERRREAAPAATRLSF